MTIALKPKELKPKKLKQNGLSKLKANKWLLGLLILISVIGVSYLTYYQLVVVPQQQAKLKIQTALVKRGNLTIAVSANGTVEPHIRHPNCHKGVFTEYFFYNENQKTLCLLTWSYYLPTLNQIFILNKKQ